MSSIIYAFQIFALNGKSLTGSLSNKDNIQSLFVSHFENVPVPAASYQASRQARRRLCVGLCMVAHVGGCVRVCEQHHITIQPAFHNGLSANSEMPCIRTARRCFFGHPALETRTSPILRNSTARVSSWTHPLGCPTRQRQPANERPHSIEFVCKWHNVWMQTYAHITSVHDVCVAIHRHTHMCKHTHYTHMLLLGHSYTSKCVAISNSFASSLLASLSSFYSHHRWKIQFLQHTTSIRMHAAHANKQIQTRRRAPARHDHTIRRDMSDISGARVKSRESWVCSTSLLHCSLGRSHPHTFV